MNEEEVARLVVRLMGKDDLSPTIKKAGEQMKHFDGEVGKSGDRLVVYGRSVEVLGMRLRGFGTMAAAVMAPLAGIGGGIASIFKGVSLAADAEMMESNFETMLGSAAKAKQMVADLQTFAAKTPLNMGDLQGFTKSLLQAGIEMEDMLPTLKMLGDAALGDAQKMHGLAYAFGQVKTMGRLMGGELLQLRNAGFDPLAEISRTSGKSIADLRKEMEQGKISFEQVKEAFRTATSEGGRFANGMEKASTTVSGLFSTMQDDIDATLREIGKSIIEEFNLKGFMKDVSAAAQATTDWFKSLSPGLKTAIASFVAMTAAVTVLIGAFFVLNAVVTATFGGFNLVLAAVVAGIAGVSVAGAAWANSLGGVAKAWAVAKQGAQDFWEWIKPIGSALYGIFEAAWGIASNLWDSIQQAAEEAFGDINLDWDSIQEAIIIGLVAIEFGLRNFGEVVDLVMTEAEVSLLSFFNTLGHWMEHLPDIVRGKKLPDRIIDGAEKDARDRLTKLQATLRDEFDKFLDKRMFEIFRQANPMWDIIFGGISASLQATEAGKKTGEAFSQAFGKEAKKVDAVLFGSAEALARIADYEERIGRANNAAAGNVKAGGAVPAVAVFGAEANQKLDQQRDLLREIARNTKPREGEVTRVVFEEVGLA